MREMTGMKRTPLSSNYMFVVVWASLVLLVIDFKLLLDHLYVVFNFLFGYFNLIPVAIFLVWQCCTIHAVKSDQLSWLPNGSELISEDAKPSASSKPKTFTSFSRSQDSLPEFSSNPLGPKNLDIILAKLGPGQVTLLSIWLLPLLL